MKRILVAYYSRTGVTRRVATDLAGLLEADLEEIRERAGRRGAMGFLGGIRDALLKRPAELVSRPSAEGRELVVLGMPVWAAAPPPAVRTFLAATDLSGRKVCAFCTFDGSGADSALKRVAELVPGGLALTLQLKKPGGDPRLADRLRAWAEQIRAL